MISPKDRYILRVKTLDEFIKEFGPDWMNKVPNGWEDNSLFGQMTDISIEDLNAKGFVTYEGFPLSKEYLVIYDGLEIDDLEKAIDYFGNMIKKFDSPIDKMLHLIITETLKRRVKNLRKSKESFTEMKDTLINELLKDNDNGLDKLVDILTKDHECPKDNPTEKDCEDCDRGKAIAEILSKRTIKGIAVQMPDGRVVNLDNKEMEEFKTLIDKISKRK